MRGLRHERRRKFRVSRDVVVTFEFLPFGREGCKQSMMAELGLKNKELQLLECCKHLDSGQLSGS